MNDATGITARLLLEANRATQRAGRAGPSPTRARRIIAGAVSVVLIGIVVTGLVAVNPRQAASGDVPQPSTVQRGGPQPETASAPPTEGPADSPASRIDREGGVPLPAPSTTDLTPFTTAVTPELPAVAVVDRQLPDRQPQQVPIESSFVPHPTGTPLVELPEPVCADGTTAEDLTALFAAGDLVVGVDYQRAYPLPSGRVLWLFQDAFLATSHGPELVHNIGLLQSGSCFQLLRTGSTNSPRPYLLAELTDRFDRWFWPLGGDIGDDGNLHVFVAEFLERGSRYLQHSEPVATWLVTIDPDDLTVTGQRPAPDPSHELYGWSVVSHGEHTYLYAHCYRQFGWDPFPFADPPARAHDWDCAPNVTVARIPRGEFSSTPEYWDGTDWTDDPSTATPVFPTEDRPVNPVQVAVLDGRFVAVTKVGDWFGRTIHLDVAPTPQGPWRTYDTITVEPQCDGCNTYFASIVRYGADEDSFLIGLSNNTWGGHDLSRYQPTFQHADAPAAAISELEPRYERNSTPQPSNLRSI